MCPDIRVFEDFLVKIFDDFLHLLLDFIWYDFFFSLC